MTKNVKKKLADLQAGLDTTSDEEFFDKLVELGIVFEDVPEESHLPEYLFSSGRVPDSENEKDLRGISILISKNKKLVCEVEDYNRSTWYYGLKLDKIMQGLSTSTIKLIKDYCEKELETR